MVELVVFVGLQGSGKSSFYQARFAQTHALVSKDLMPNNRRRGDRQRELVLAALRQGRSVVVDNTNPRRSDRAELVQLAHSLGSSVVVYHFTTPLGECLARNRLRHGRARVPDVALLVTRKRLEAPAADEGFDARFEVTPGSAPGEFDVRPL